METSRNAADRPGGLSLGERILILRRRLDLSLSELEQKSGIDQTTLSRYEHDRREPRGKALAALADALETTPNDLLAYYRDREPATPGNRVTLDELGQLDGALLIA